MTPRPQLLVQLAREVGPRSRVDREGHRQKGTVIDPRAPGLEREY